MKKTWMTPDICDLTIRATENRGGNCDDDNPSPEMFHCSGAMNGESVFDNNMPGQIPDHRPHGRH